MIGRYRKWDVVEITEKFYGLSSYSCYFSAVAITIAVAVTTDVVVNQTQKYLTAERGEF